MTDTAEKHTVDEALSRFTLVRGAGSPASNTACVLTALSWVAGQSWTDSLPCAHPLLRSWAIRANDADGTTAEQRADLVRAGETGILDTWWVPAEVCLWALSEAPTDAGVVDRMLSVCSTISTWKAAAAKQRPDLRNADLRDADLGGAYLRNADLRNADLRDADLRNADLRDADLRNADLRDADLGGAYLGGADLRNANLRNANLGGADLGGADLGGADLGGANLRSANLRSAWYSKFTAFPTDFDAKAAGALEL